MVEKLNATICFEAVAGELTGKILSVMPPKSVCYVYGLLSGAKCSEIDPIDLIFKEKEVKGFWLTSYLNQMNIFSKIFFFGGL